MSAIGASAAAGVLVVEDDGDLREALAECLRFEGYDVVEAVDGADALARLQRGARPALIILDLVMPRMDGRQLLAAMRVDADLAGIPVVLATGTRPQDLSQEVQVLLKPIGLDDLLACVRRYCDLAPPGTSTAPQKLLPAS
ncbi:MAG TPA: response regulator [Anaeromyxobacter sp.]|nr:response regulator [Anaeromyxobacter sp.]